MTLSGPPRDQARLVSAQEPRMTCLLSAAHWARDTHVSPHVYLCYPGECGPAPAHAPPPRTAPPPTRPHCAPARPRGCCCPAPRALEDVVTTCHVSRVTRPGHLALRTPGRLHAPPLYSAHFWSDPFHLCGGFTGLHSAQVAPSNSSLPLKLKQFFLTRHEAGLRRISQITDRTQTSVSKYFFAIREDFTVR